jgi:glycosyltransferase involved in cell wall biosynthesis
VKKVLALIEYPENVCYRYRIAAFAPALAEQGLAMETECVRRGILARTAQLLAARRADVVLLQRKLLGVAHVRLLRLAAKRLAFDVDDAVFERGSYHCKGPHSRKLGRRFQAAVAAADAVIAGNAYLGRRAAENADPARVHVIPTCVDPRHYVPAVHDRTAIAVRLVWIGSSYTLQTMQRAEPWLTAVARRLPGLELRLICDRGWEVPGLRVVPRPWSAATEAAELAACDIGVSWLPDDGFTRGKCGLKLLQYMAAALPVVTNPVGVHPQIVLPGQTGLLASTPDEWADAVARLAADPALRRRMGQAGRQRVEEHYSVQRWGPRLADLLSDQPRAISSQHGDGERGVVHGFPMAEN